YEGGGYEGGADPGRYDRPPVGPMGFRDRGGGRRFSSAKIVAGVLALGIIAALGVFIITKMLQSDPTAGPTIPTVTSPAVTTPPAPSKVALTVDQIRVVDPPNGDRTQTGGIENVVDGNPSTGWRTSGYTNAEF